MQQNATRILLATIIFDGWCFAYSGEPLIQEVKNFQIENINMKYMAIWDPLLNNDTVFYTLTTNNSSGNGCVNITRSNCELPAYKLPPYLDHEFVLWARQGATLVGKAEKTVYLFNVDRKLSSPQVNITRCGKNISMYLQYPSPDFIGKTKFKGELFYYVKGSIQRTLQKVETTNTAESFVSSVPEESTVCIKAAITWLDRVTEITHTSSLAQACTNSSTNDDCDVFGTTSKEWLVVVIVVFVCLSVAVSTLLTVRWFKRTATVSKLELPGETITVVAMSEKDVGENGIVNEWRGSTESIYLIEGTNLLIAPQDVEKENPKISVFSEDVNAVTRFSRVAFEHIMN